MGHKRTSIELQTLEMKRSCLCQSLERTIGEHFEVRLKCVVQGVENAPRTARIPVGSLELIAGMAAIDTIGEAIGSLRRARLKVIHRQLRPYLRFGNPAVATR